MKKGSLTVCGSGTKAIAHLTLETVGHIRHAEKLFYQACDRLTEKWIREQNSSAESLSTSYVPGRLRVEIYSEIVERILAPVREGLRVCATFYGHPGVVVFSGHQGIAQARKEGFEARMLPGISAEDCLYADLGVDPVANGCVSLEARDVVLLDRRLDPTLDLVIWQIGFIGHEDYQEVFSVEGIEELAELLVSVHGADHEAALYEAASFVAARPRIERVRLGDLAGARVTGFSTLYVPASSVPKTNTRRAEQLSQRIRNSAGGLA